MGEGRWESEPGFQRRVVEAAQAQGAARRSVLVCGDRDRVWAVCAGVLAWGVGAGDAGGEDWEASSHVADVLAQIFAWHNAGRGLVFRAALTNAGGAGRERGDVVCVGRGWAADRPGVQGVWGGVGGGCRRVGGL